MQPQINVQAQQSRYHVDTLNSSPEIDLRDVSITVGDTPILASAHIRFKEGVRYALLGRNGTGKSTLMKALSDNLIPGINPALRITMLSQVGVPDLEQGAQTSVIQTVLLGDKERQALLRKQAMLSEAVNNNEAEQVAATLAQLLLEQRQQELVDVRRIATRRSGARGKVARKEEIAAEEEVKAAEQRLDASRCAPSDDSMEKAVQMLADMELQLNLLESASAEARARAILSGLGFTDSMLDGPYARLSGGWRGRCSLSVALLVQCDVLLLDEPSNYLDLEALLWLERYLVSRHGTLVVTSHDQTFLDHIAQETVVLKNETLKYFDGTPTNYQIEEKKERRNLVKQQAALDKKKEHIQASISQGMAAARKTGDDNKGKMAKSRQKKLDERFGVEKSAKGTRFKLNRDLAGYHLANRAELVVEEEEGSSRISLPEPASLRTTGNLIHLEKVSLKFKGTAKPLLQDVNLTIPQGAKLAIVGQNGQGKSSLAKLLAGQLPPSSGSIERHPTATIGFYSQHLSEDLSSVEDTALQHFAKCLAEKDRKADEQTIRRSLAAFGLQGKTVSATPVKSLSGGQKVRLAMALVAFWQPSLLILDEPSAHLDVSTVQALGRALRNHKGALVIITHDRWLCKYAIEGCSFTQAFGDDAASREIEGEHDSNESDTAEDNSRGLVLRISNGKAKPMDKGIDGHVEAIERKLAKFEAILKNG